MSVINFWIVATVGDKFGHEYMSDEEEYLYDSKYPIFHNGERMGIIMEKISNFCDKTCGWSDKLTFRELDDDVLSFVNWMHHKTPDNILEKMQNFFRLVGEEFPASYGLCTMFDGEEPSPIAEVTVLKLVGKTLLTEKDPFFARYLPKYEEGK
ncbi:hypothetical protein [Labrys wisconsinensis]|uniref:Uncharacterized protein n=1 Tax=Labrys wisconsinensis TaxID=425677 RepID=A0ABU0J3Z5_9HYPH|nr:hypothetical protein [Labrys wisconsinensis]MDQ0468256.1 hypothetical protein [Labrys wisconsinensis]